MTDPDDTEDRGPMPEDPDLADLPEQWRNLDGKTIQWIEPDGTRTTANLAVLPGAWGDRRRRREGFYDDTDDDGGTQP